MVGNGLQFTPVNTPMNCIPYLIPWGVGRTESVNPENRIEAHPQITLEATLGSYTRKLQPIDISLSFYSIYIYMYTKNA